MQQHWFHTVWPFVGGGAAIVMVAILLTTKPFRSNNTVSRWRDPVWLAWLAAPLYWVHQLEEYSLPVIGLPYSLPDMVCGQFDFPPYPACPIPMSARGGPRADATSVRSARELFGSAAPESLHSLNHYLNSFCAK